MANPPDPVEKELKAAQRAYESGTQRRRNAVGRAYLEELTAEGEHRWSVYRIAKTLGVSETTVQAILKAYRREREEEAGQEKG